MTDAIDSGLAFSSAISRGNPALGADDFGLTTWSAKLVSPVVAADPAKTKAELIKYLKGSFDYSNRVIATLTAENALDRIEGRYAGPNTKLGISVVSVWHVTDHYGQLVEYLRMNGIVPPMTQKYGLKVR